MWEREWDTQMPWDGPAAPGTILKISTLGIGSA